MKMGWGPRRRRRTNKSKEEIANYIEREREREIRPIAVGGGEIER